MESKGRLDIPFPWLSVKLFITNSCYATTTRNTQHLNTTEIDCISCFTSHFSTLSLFNSKHIMCFKQLLLDSLKLTPKI